MEATFREKIAKCTVIAVLVLLPVVSHAGGLGVAPLAFIMGLVGIYLHFTSSEPRFRASSTFIFLVFFLTWLCVASLWSPYHSDDVLSNYSKLFVMGLAFYFCPTVFKQLTPESGVIAIRLFLTTTLLGGLLVLMDIWSGFKISLFFHPPSSPEDLGNRLRDVELNLGSANTLLVLLSSPYVILIKNHSQYWKIFSAVFLIVVVAMALSNNLWIGAVSTFFVILVMQLAYKFPRKTPQLVLGISSCTILFAPLIAYLSNLVIKNDLSAIPLSWEHRLRMWDYCWDKILENPILGDGFDASRMYSETWTARNGYDLPIVSMHPHNAGIQLWTEAGFIGVVLVLVLILFSVRVIGNNTSTPDRSALVSGVLVAVILISSMSYGAWQFWWWGCIFLSFGFVHLLPKDNVT